MWIWLLARAFHCKRGAGYSDAVLRGRAPRALAPGRGAGLESELFCVSAIQFELGQSGETARDLALCR